jgi:hypothetical protein
MAPLMALCATPRNKPKLPMMIAIAAVPNLELLKAFVIAFIDALNKHRCF